jgi:hypothetical protein
MALVVGHTLEVIDGVEYLLDIIELKGVRFYGYGFLPLRRNKQDLIEDMRRGKGPEWRK